MELFLNHILNLPSIKILTYFVVFQNVWGSYDKNQIQTFPLKVDSF